MGTEQIGIVKSILQTRADFKAEASGKNLQQDMAVSFTDFMKKDDASASVNVNVSENPKEAAPIQDDTGNVTQSAYDANANPIKSIAVKEEIVPEEVWSEAGGLLENYEDAVKGILKEMLGVTEEEITDAMEFLGMNVPDFRNLKDVSVLIQTLTGEDVGTLFLSESFQVIMERVTAATETLCEELGVTKEEFQALCETWEQTAAIQADRADQAGQANQAVPADQAGIMSHADRVNQADQTTGKADRADAADEAEPLSEAEMPEIAKEQRTPESRETPSAIKNAETPDASKEAVYAAAADDVDVRQTAVSQTDGMESKPEQETMQQVKPVMDAMEETGEDTNSDEQNFSRRPENVKPVASDTQVHTAFPEVQTMRTAEIALPEEGMAQPYFSQTETMDMIDQIARNVRVTISAEVTSMELQLNPEHLGKIYLNVTEKEGTVHARIAAQNHAVKEALETQVAELRQSLNQQGIKVTAIEVTVATHEFEQNLEENARQESQMQQQREGAEDQSRRNLNRNELSSLSGIMTEEEQLAAQIMKDHGNQVDLTA